MTNDDVVLATIAANNQTPAVFLAVIASPSTEIGVDAAAREHSAMRIQQYLLSELCSTMLSIDEQVERVCEQFVYYSFEAETRLVEPRITSPQLSSRFANERRADPNRGAPLDRA